MKPLKWLIGTVFFCLVHLSRIEGIVCSCSPCTCDPCYESNPYAFCGQCCCDLEFDIFADALYWKYSRADLEFSVFDQMNSIEIVDHVSHDYHWGYRVGGRISCNDWGLGVRYTHFCDDTRETFDLVEVAEILDLFHNIEINVVDIELGYLCCLPCCNLTIRPLAGAKLAWVDDDFDKLDALDNFAGTLDFHGYGAYLGVASRWEICNWCPYRYDLSIALITRAAVTILSGKFDIEIDEDSFGFFEITDEYLYVPVQELFVAIDFSLCNLCGLDAFFQIGYETQLWNGWRQWFDDDDITTWGIGGLVLRLGVGF